LTRYRADKEVDLKELRDSVRCIIDAATDASLWVLDRSHETTESVIFAVQGIAHDAVYYSFGFARFNR